MKRYIFLLPLLLLLTGCETLAVNYEDYHKAVLPEPYTFKFYLKKVSVGYYFPENTVNMMMAPNDIKRQEQLKASLLEKFPQYFTSEQHGHPECEIILIKRDGKSPNEVAAGFGFLLLGLPTLGLIPIRVDKDFTYDMTIKCCGFDTEHKIYCKQVNVASLGILGAVFQTHRWVNVDSFHDISYNSTWLFPQSEHLHKVIADAFNKLDRNKIIEYYNSSYAEKVNLLE